MTILFKRLSPAAARFIAGSPTPCIGVYTNLNPSGIVEGVPVSSLRALKYASRASESFLMERGDVSTKSISQHMGLRCFPMMLEIALSWGGIIWHAFPQ